MSNPMPGREVRIFVSPKVAGNAEQMNRVTKEILGRLGCGTCHSGFNLRFILQEDFAVDENLNVRSVAAGF